MSVHDLLSVIHVYHTHLWSGVIRAGLLLRSEKWVSKFQVQVQIQFQIHVYIFLFFGEICCVYIKEKLKGKREIGCCS